MESCGERVPYYNLPCHPISRGGGMIFDYVVLGISIFSLPND